MSERMTTIVSALVALGILGLGVTAQPTGDGDGVRVESLESDVRFQIEMSWRHDGRTRTARQAELETTLEAFEKSPQSPADVQLLEQWLRAAVVASLPGESGRFPVTPAFGKSAVAVQPPATDSPATTPPTPAPAIAPAKQAAQPPRDVELKPNQAYTPPRAREIRLTPRSQQARTPEPAESTPQRIVAAKPVAPAPTPTPIQTPRQAAAPARMPEASPAPPTPAIASTQPPRMIESDVEPAEQKPQETKPVTSAPPVVAEKATPPEPTVVAPLSELPTPTTIVAEEASAPPAPPIAAKPVAPAPPASDPVTVNLAELNAQIRGYHEGLDEIDAQIVARRGKLSEGEIARLVVQLEQLAGHHSFVRLYYDGLSKSERRFVSAPRSLNETVELVRSELAALNAAEEDFLTSLEGAAEEDELNRRLDELSGDGEPDNRDEPAAKEQR